MVAAVFSRTIGAGLEPRIASRPHERTRGINARTCQQAPAARRHSPQHRQRRRLSQLLRRRAASRHSASTLRREQSPPVRRPQLPSARAAPRPQRHCPPPQHAHAPSRASLRRPCVASHTPRATAASARPVPTAAMAHDIGKRWRGSPRRAAPACAQTAQRCSWRCGGRAWRARRGGTARVARPVQRRGRCGMNSVRRTFPSEFSDGRARSTFILFGRLRRRKQSEGGGYRDE